METSAYAPNPPVHFTVLPSGKLHCGHCPYNINSGFCDDCLDDNPQAIRGSRGVIWATEQELASMGVGFTMERQQELLGTKENARRIYEELLARL